MIEMSVSVSVRTAENFKYESEYALLAVFELMTSVFPVPEIIITVSRVLRVEEPLHRRVVFYTIIYRDYSKIMCFYI